MEHRNGLQTVGIPRLCICRLMSLRHVEDRRKDATLTKSTEDPKGMPIGNKSRIVMCRAWLGLDLSKNGDIVKKDFHNNRHTNILYNTECKLH